MGKGLEKGLTGAPLFPIVNRLHEKRGASHFSHFHESFSFGPRVSIPLRTVSSGP